MNTLDLQAMMQRNAKFHAVREATRSFPMDLKQQLLAELMKDLNVVIEVADEGPKPAPKSLDSRQLTLLPEHTKNAAKAHKRSAKSKATVKAPPAATPRAAGTSKTDLAEAYIHAHPEGATFQEIIAAIGQESPAAASTLQYLKKKRGTIDNRENRWYPSGRVAPPRKAKAARKARGVGGARKSAYRDVILSVLAESKPLETKDIFSRVQAILPEATYPSAASEIKRMHQRKLIVQRGDGTNGRLYTVPKAARQQAAATA